MGAAPLVVNVGTPVSEDPKLLRQHLSQLIAGLNGTGFVRILDPKGDKSFRWTATANAASTTITDSSKRLWGYASAVIFIPMTANADAVALPYVTQANLLPGSMTITHVNNANADKTYRIVVIG